MNDSDEHEVIVQSSRDIPEVFEETCFYLTDWIRQHRGESFAFLVDDARLMFSGGPGKKIPQDFSWMLRSTKIGESRIVLTTWRIVDIPPEVRSQADHWMIFKTTEPRDLELIEERFGPSAREQVMTLPPHVYLHGDDSGPELRVTVEMDSPSWYVDTHVLQEELVEVKKERV